MNRKQLILTLLALAVLGGASLLLLKHNDQSWSAPPGKMGEKLLPNFQVNDVAALDIQAGSPLHLDRNSGTWKVRERGNYPADFSKISQLLISLSNLKIAQSEPLGPSQLAHLELQPPGSGAGSGVRVTFSDDKGKAIQSLLLGKKSTQKSASSSPFGGGEYPNGRYLLRGDDAKTLLLVSDPLTSVETNPAVWLDQQFFKVEKPSSFELISTNATNSWKLTRASESSPWLFATTNAGDNLDSNKVSSLPSALTWVNFVDVATNASASETGLDKPSVVKICTFDHFNYEIKVGNKTPEENYYFTVSVSADLPSARTPGKDEKPEDKAKLDKDFEAQTKTLQDKLAQEKALAPWVYFVNAMQLEPILRSRNQLMVEKPAEGATNSVPAAPATGDSSLLSPALLSSLTNAAPASSTPPPAESPKP